MLLNGFVILCVFALGGECLLVCRGCFVLLFVLALCGVWLRVLCFVCGWVFACVLCVLCVCALLVFFVYKGLFDVVFFRCVC